MNRRTLLAGLAASGLPVAAVASAAPNPDAGIPALVRCHRLNFDRFSAYSGPDEGRDESLWSNYIETLDAVIECKPQTFAGLFAKAQVVRFDGDDDTLKQSLVNDLLRLAEAVS